jgi:hypothetical protein
MLWVLFLEVALQALHHQYLWTTLFTVEDSDEITNFNPTRRIKLGESKPVTWPTNAGITRNLSKKGTTDGGKSGVVPHHLLNLYNEAAAGRTTGEQEEILHPLHQQQYFDLLVSHNQMDSSGEFYW